MRVVMLSTSASHHPSPRGRWLPLARAAVAQGIAVTVLGLHPHYQTLQPRISHDAGVTIQHVAQMHVNGSGALRGMRLYGTALWAAFQLARQAIAYRPDVICLCKAQPINSLAALIAQRWSGARLILDVDDDEADSHQFAHAWQRRLVAWGEQSIPHHASTITTASAWLRQRYGSNALHVPNGLEPAQFTPASPSAQTAFQQRYQLPSRYLLYFGNLATQSHGVDVLLQALAQSTTHLPLVIAGDGHERAALQQLAEQLGIAARCLWLGQIAPSDIPALLARAHASIDPVRATIAAAARFPLKICESLAQGVPVITSPVGDRATLVGEAGILVPAGDSQALATALTVASIRVFDAPHIQAQVRQLEWTHVAPRWLAHHRLVRDA